MRYKTTENALIIMVSDEAERLELEQLWNDNPDIRDTDSFMCDVLEPVTCNGLTWVLPEDIGALTDAPLLSEGSYDDSGKWTDDAPIYYFNNYALYSPIRDLVEDGNVMFHRSF